MLKLLSKLYLSIIGWKFKGSIPMDVKKCVVIAAPHTSNSDLPIALAALCIMGIKIKYLMKKEIFKFPFSILFKATGGIPVVRSKHTRMVDSIIEMFDMREEFIVMIPPEATRKKVDKWKTGFYYVALGAKVPIALGYLDYAKKEAGFGPLFTPTGDIKKDFKFLQHFYMNVTAKYPQKFNPDSIVVEHA